MRTDNKLENFLKANRPLPGKGASSLTAEKLWEKIEGERLPFLSRRLLKYYILPALSFAMVLLMLVFYYSREDQYSELAQNLDSSLNLSFLDSTSGDLDEVKDLISITDEQPEVE
jgi:hypothetical protein